MKIRWTVTWLAAVLLVLFAGGVAAAEQAKYYGSGDSYELYYIPTTVGQIYERGTLDRLKQDNKFEADGRTLYPNEIYLPNERFPANYRVHTNYSKDTDACASCHATHTAVGTSLLQWYTVFDACMACHDGTVTTTYNVVTGKIGASEQWAFGGMFGSGAEHFLSSHNVTGAVNISAAPGGSTVSIDKEGTARTGNEEEEYEIIAWGVQFGCESCHTPHGQGGNARILHPDPNGWARLNKPGYYIKKSYREHVTGLVDTGSGYQVLLDGEPQLLIQGYPYRTKFLSAGGSEITGPVVDNASGVSVISGSNLSAVAAVYATPALVVKMDIDNYLGRDGSNRKALETVTHIKGINEFCGACHSDYNTGETEDPLHTGDQVSGKYSQAYRHKVGVDYDYNNSNPKYIGVSEYVYDLADGWKQSNVLKVDADGKITCLTCHFAHGVSRSLWLSALGELGWSEHECEEVAGSSALKRMPNMAACEACHQKQRENEGYLANSGLTLLPEYPLGGTDDAVFIVGGEPVQDESSCYRARCHPGYEEYISEDSRHNHGEGGSEGAAVGCQQCHGNGNAHVKAPSTLNIVNPAVKPVERQINDDSFGCLRGSCHNSTIGSFTRTEFSGSRHRLSGVISCNTCHDSHGVNSEGRPLKMAKQQLCAACHGETMTFTDHAFD